MNATEGMSDEELDVWADIFVQAHLGAVIDVPFSQFISNPIAYLNSADYEVIRSRTRKRHLRLVHSKSVAENVDPRKVTTRGHYLCLLR